MTLDGMFEGPQPWDLEFHEYAWGDELRRFLLEQGGAVGALLFGRATYDGMGAHWTTATGEIADFMAEPAADLKQPAPRGNPTEVTWCKSVCTLCTP